MAQNISHGYGSDLTSDSYNLKFKDLSGSNKILSGFRVVPGTSGLKVSFNHGSAATSLAYVNGVRVEENIPVNDIVTLPTAHATLGRYDVVALRYVWGVTNAPATYQVISGSPNASPVVPSVPDETYVKLAHVLVAAAATTVITGNITQSEELKSAASWGGKAYFVQTTQPSSGSSGDHWLDTSVTPNIWKFHDGSGWTPGALVNLTGSITDAQHGTRSGGTLHPAATQAVAGFMSAADKVKTDNSIHKDGTIAMTGPLTLPGDPTLNLQAAPKQYIDNAINVRQAKQDVRAATTVNITLSTLQVIDGVTPVAGDRILVKDQTTASQNGIYVAAVGTWTRASDSDTSAKVTSNMFLFVSEGTVNTDSGWFLSANNPVTLGTTNLTFIQFTGTGQITATGGLTKAANTLSIIDNGVTDAKIGNRTISDTTAPTTDTGTLSGLLGFLANMVKSITGKVNWRTAPATTLEAANTHMISVANPHSVTATQVGALISVEGVSNPGGNIDLVPGGAITITGNDAGNTITITETHSALTNNPHATTAVQVSALPITGGTLTGTTTVDGGGGIFQLKPGTADHVYMAFFGRTATPGVRTGYIGYGGAAATGLEINNQLTNGDILLTTNGTGRVTTTRMQLVASTPSIDLAGSEASGRIYTIKENAGKLEFYDNTASSTTPVFVMDATGSLAVFKIGSLSIRNNAGKVETSVDNITWSLITTQADVTKTAAAMALALGG